MSFDKGRHAATADRPVLTNHRRVHLGALRTAVQAHPQLGGELVERRGVSWVSVVGYGMPRRTLDIGCDYRDGAWWFCRLSDGSPIARAEDITACVAAIARELGSGSMPDNASAT